MSALLSKIRTDFFDLVAPKIGGDQQKDFETFLEFTKKDKVKGVDNFFTMYCQDMSKITGAEHANEYKNCLVSIFSSQIRKLYDENY